MPDRSVLRRSTHVDASDADGGALDVLKALASEPRLRILRYLGDRVVAVNRIALDLGLPPSTAAMHVAELEQAGLISCELRPASRGLRKVCSRTYDEIVVGLPGVTATHGAPMSSACPSVRTRTSRWNPPAALPDPPASSG